MSTHNTEERNEILELSAKFTPTTLTPAQEVALSKLVLNDPMQSGEDMFTLLAWAIPARAQELLLMRWSDIAPIPRTNGGMAISVSEHIHLLRNANNTRVIPLPTKVQALLLERKKQILEFYRKAIEAELSSDEVIVEIDHLPICCSGDQFADNGDLIKMVEHCRERLLQAGVSKDTLRLMELTIKHSDNPTVQREGYAEIYLMRKTFGTHAHILGLTKAETCYLMDIPND